MNNSTKFDFKQTSLELYKQPTPLTELQFKAILVIKFRTKARTFVT